MSGISRGSHSFCFTDPPVISSWASAAGPKESQGPLGLYFDIKSEDTLWGQKTWEQGEKKMQQMVLHRLAQKADLPTSSFRIVFSGDLLNQCIVSSLALKNTGIPHIGLYGACSTMAEALLLSSMAVGGGFAPNAVAMTSSHFASAERQYRFPLGYGGQRSPSAQWTVTGAGSCLIEASGRGPKITGCTIGSVADLGIKDTANMGAAMAPAALSAIRTHLDDFSATPEDYDFIITGDLGHIGKNLLMTMAEKEGLYLSDKLKDCGEMIFDINNQDVHAGGSGCGCSAITLCGYLLEGLKNKEFHKILFCGTGALLSPTSSQQKLAIPGICHAVILEGN